MVRASLKKYVLIYLSPLLVLLLISMLQSWANSNLIWERLDPPVSPIPPIPKCYGEGCVTLAYCVGEKEEAYIEAAMEYVKKSN